MGFSIKTNSENNPPQVTRLAPSPTGALHLGNLRTFLINWALARQNGWKIVFRIEDLDGPRKKNNADEQAIEILKWVGLDWDQEPIYQSRDLTLYHDALNILSSKNLIYPCTCSRNDIQNAQSAPHEDDHELHYPGTCRPPSVAKVGQPSNEAIDKQNSTAWRVIAPDEPVTFEDKFLGTQSINVQKQVGDFVVATKAGLPAYQLAVVVDDVRQGVTQVVRGDDLVNSTPRQILLYEMLGNKKVPQYTHVPLVIGADGRRLAKRHGDSRLAYYRSLGVAPEKIVGLMAYWCGASERRMNMTAEQFARNFALDKLPKGAVVFSHDDDKWLKE